MANENRLVRIKNDKIHNLISYAAKLTKLPYQHVFNVFCTMIIDGYILGSDTHLILIEKSLKLKVEE
jgi:hypothetical protein